MKKAYTVTNVLESKFKVLGIKGKWKDAIGTPELTGSWIIYGPPKNGKTSFAFQLSKYLTNFGKVVYDSIEEGISLSIQDAVKRTELQECGNRWHLLDKDDIDTLIARLKKQRSADIIFIDSVQFAGINMREYKKLKREFPNKLFIFISHVKGNEPDGTTAIGIKRDANVVFRIEGFRAFPTSRFGGDGSPLDIWQKKAKEYWGAEAVNNE